MQQERQVELTILKSTPNGYISYEELETAISEKTKAVICTHASNLTGNVLDVERIGKICKQHHILFAVDASQSAGIIPIDVQKMGISILCFTGHKGLLGPQGTGGIYVAPDVKIKSWKVGGSGIKSFSKTQPEEMPVLLEAGTLNAHGIAGLHASLQYILEKDVSTIYKEEWDKLQYFYQGVKDIPNLTIYGDPTAAVHAPILTFNIGEYDSAEVADELMISYDIACRAGAHCAPLMHQAFKTVDQGAVRFSFSQFNTKEELDAGISSVKELADSSNELLQD